MKTRSRSSAEHQLQQETAPRPSANEFPKANAKKKASASLTLKVKVDPRKPKKPPTAFFFYLYSPPSPLSFLFLTPHRYNISPFHPIWVCRLIWQLQLSYPFCFLLQGRFPEDISAGKPLCQIHATSIYLSFLNFIFQLMSLQLSSFYRIHQNALRCLVIFGLLSDLMVNAWLIQCQKLNRFIIGFLTQQCWFFLVDWKGMRWQMENTTLWGFYIFSLPIVWAALFLF
jgi:hypothetical protein